MRTFIRGFGLGMVIGLLYIMVRMITVVGSQSGGTVGVSSPLLICGLVTGIIAVLIKGCKCGCCRK